MSWLTKKKVVVPLDFSEDSLKGLAVALEITSQPTDIHVIHVLPELSALEPGRVWGEITDETRIESATRQLTETVSSHGGEFARIHVTVGDPGEEITELAKREDAELIVMPSHGRRGLQRLLIGSVAERVIRLAPCPVLVLRD